MEKPWEKYYSEEARAFDVTAMAAVTLPAALDQAAASFGNRPALTTILPNGAQTTLTYTEFARHADSFAIYLREVAGLKRGDTVALMAPNCIGFAIAAMGVAKAGCALTNVNPLYTASELEHQLVDSNAQALVIIDLFGDKIDKVISKTDVKQVVTLSLPDFFPPVKKALLGFVLKRVRKVVPTMETPHITLTAALAQGRRAAPASAAAAYAADIAGTDTALYQYTSGTTGRSKGAELSHQAVLGNACVAYLMTSSRHSSDGETTLVALPLYHITAFSLILVAGIRTGGHAVLVPSPRPASNLKSAFEKHRITWFSGINSLFAAMMTEPWFDRSLFQHIRYCGSGGAAQTTGVARKWEQMSGISIFQGYGMTEVAGVLTLNPLTDNRLGKVGIPVPGAEVRIVDDDGKDVAPGAPGEVIARTPTMMKGYLNRPDSNAETIRDGWLHTGDIGIMDDDGFLEIVDRKKDMILVSGFNVSPNEIEDVISRIPGVVQVGVIGIPDEKSGEVPAAFVLREGDSLTAEAITAACRETLTNYKIPKRIEFVDEVPTTVSGKVLRRELRDRHVG